jgi:hypothetical protein
MRPWTLTVIVFIAGVAFAVSVTWALVAGSGQSTAADKAALRGPTPEPDRTNCDEIYGTAYRSAEERRWFSENCSDWAKAVGDLPLTQPTPEPRGAAPSGEPSTPPPEGRDCNEIRGRPYRSDSERDWYRANCGPNSPAAQPQATNGQDRTDCNQIRGTPYRSDSERRWFQENCGPGQQPVTNGPDRTDCNAIRGTPYRSDNERRWFQENCSAR